MSDIVDIRKADDPRDVIHRAVQLLAEGNVVVFPTETVYAAVAHAQQADAVSQLLQLSNTLSGHAALAIKSADEALKYVPEMSQLGRKLSQRCWPGPITFVFTLDRDKGRSAALPESSRAAVTGDEGIRLRIPAHESLLHVLNLMPEPLVLSTEDNGDASPPRTAVEAAARFGDGVALIIDDGPCQYGQTTSEVQINGKAWKMVREVVVPRRTINRLAGTIYLFVCTGNTCRSPMAEGLFRKMLAEKLRCEEDDLGDRGYMVASAGLAAAYGGPPSPDAVQIMRGKGVEIGSHSSQPLTLRLLGTADHVYTMTGSHRDSILSEHAGAGDHVSVLSAEGADISDPIGMGTTEYRNCAEQIERNLQTILAEIPEPNETDSQ